METLTESEKIIEKQARSWVKRNKDIITHKFANLSEYPKVIEPVSVFMAGTPGAGKTEYSKRLMDEFESKPVRIDSDEIRNIMNVCGYTGNNSYVFQNACTAAVNNLFHHCLKNSQNIILDGTFAYKEATRNIEESLSNKNKVAIFYIYQDPLKAWEFTKVREIIEHRHVSKDVFISAYFKSRNNVNEAKNKFGNQIELNLVIKEYEHTGKEKVEFGINKLDGYLPKLYTPDELQMLLK